MGLLRECSRSCLRRKLSGVFSPFYTMVRYRFLLFLYLISAAFEYGLAEFVHVGAILDEETVLGKTSRASILASVEDFYDAHLNYSTRLVIHTRHSGGDVAGAAWAAYELIKDVEVEAILGPQTSPQAEVLADLGEKEEVPVISFSATSLSVSPAVKPYFIRAALDDAARANAVASLLSHFGFKEVVILCDGTSQEASWIAHLVDALQVEGIRVPFSISIAGGSTDDHIREELQRSVGKKARVFVAHLSAALARRLFLKARDVGLMGDGHVWVVTDALGNFLHELDDSAVNAMRGVMGVRHMLRDESEIEQLRARVELKLREENPSVQVKQLTIFDLWAYDAVWALAAAAEKAGKVSRHTGRGFRRKLTSEISNVRFRGKSGEFHVSDGQLIGSAFQVVNIAGEKAREVGEWSQQSDRTSLSSREIVWPGDYSSSSRGWEMLAGGRKLRVVVPRKSGFSELVNVTFNPEDPESRVSFGGFCIEVFDEVKSALRYKVDYEYTLGDNQETSGSYNDLIDLLISQKYDAIVGDVTIMANRSEYVDFTLPYTESGVWMLVRTEKNDSSNGWIFLDPLGMDLWGGFLGFFFFTGFVIWAMEQRINPEFRGPPIEQLGTTFYFTLSTLVFAHRERLRSNLSRLVVIVWIFVVLILISSYTASLASMLTVQRLQPATVEDLVKNGDFVGYQEGSFVANYLRARNFHPSKMIGYETPEEYDAALLRGSGNGGVTAIFDEMPYFRIFLANRCSEYNVFGPVLNTKGFGFVFPRGSPLAADASRAILEATEKGLLEPLEKKWFGDEVSCRMKNSAYQPTKLSFKRFSGLFILSGAVSAAALVIFLARYLCKYWNELRDSSSGKPFWKRVGAWARHYVRVDPAIVEEGNSLPPSACSAAESVQSIEAKVEKSSKDSASKDMLQEAQEQLNLDAPIELQESKKSAS